MNHKPVKGSVIEVKGGGERGIVRLKEKIDGQDYANIINSTAGRLLHIKDHGPFERGREVTVEATSLTPHGLEVIRMS